MEALISGLTWRYQGATGKVAPFCLTLRSDR